MASLVEQIIAQSQIGSANGAGFGDSFFQGMQLGQRQQQINLQKRQVEQQLAQEAAMMPLKQTLLQQDAAMNSAKLTSFLEARQDSINNESQLLQLNQNVARSFTEADGPETAQQMLFESLTKNPRLISDPRFQELRKMVDTSLQAKEQLIRLRNERAGVEGLGGVSIVTDPLTGEQKTYVRESTGTIAPFQKTDPNKPQSTMGKLIADRNAAVQAGDREAVAAFDAEIKMRQTKDGFAITTNPDGTVTVTQGKQSDLTPTNQTRVQQGLSGALQTIDTANRLEPLIDNETVGVQAFAESWIKDRILAQRFPNMASKKRANAETLVAELRASAVQELKTDSNITEAERKQILEAVPDINAPIDSPARAKDLVAGIRRMSAIRAVVSAGKLKQPMPKAAAQLISPTELKRLVDTGVITKEQALEIFDAR